jgi:hypothetical protein
MRLSESRWLAALLSKEYLFLCGICFVYMRKFTDGGYSYSKTLDVPAAGILFSSM